MKILVVGGGGREHAIVKSLSRGLDGGRKIFCAPGNAGIAELAECVPIASTDIEGLFAFAKKQGIDFTVVGNDDPLALGIADRFISGGLKIFGPVKEAAKLEWSKAYAKSFMKKYNIPHAKYEIFQSFDSAAKYCAGHDYPLAVKADGLAVGKGVYICHNYAEAEQALTEIMVDGKFGSSGKQVVVEDFLQGVETTVMAFCDGETLVPMISAKDHKKAFDGDKGPNTGGMGVITPSPAYTDEVRDFCEKNIFAPTLDGLRSECISYKGIIYFELMIFGSKASVIEYNSRFGDPEAQAVLPRLKTDLLDIMEAVSDGKLAQIDIDWTEGASACVVLASEGYPGSYGTGFPITGLKKINADEAFVFHAGTKKSGAEIVTSGGRVLAVTAVSGLAGSAGLEEALKNCYLSTRKISFKGLRFRGDIGK